MLFASLYAPDGGWLKRIAGTLVQGVSLGTLDAPSFAPATGYISFFALALYVIGLTLMSMVDGRQQMALPQNHRGDELMGYRQKIEIPAHTTTTEKQ